VTWINLLHFIKKKKKDETRKKGKKKKKLCKLFPFPVLILDDCYK